MEIDLHLPEVDMLGWKEVMQISISIKKGCYCRVIPFGWDAETSTCSIILDMVRDTAFARWANLLRRCDEVQYINICSCSEELEIPNQIVGIADSTNFGFLLALEQVTRPVSRFEAFVLCEKSFTAKLFHEYFNTQIITATDQESLLSKVLTPQFCSNHTSFYLGGDSYFNKNISLALKAMNYQNIHVLPFSV
jgi:hypothetical protein